VRVLQASDELGLGGEAPDEVGVIGVLRQDDLDRDLASDVRLEGGDGAGGETERPLTRPTLRAAWTKAACSLVGMSRASASSWASCLDGRNLPASIFLIVSTEQAARSASCSCVRSRALR
jgi:hypothetical protein